MNSSDANSASKNSALKKPLHSDEKMQIRCASSGALGDSSSTTNRNNENQQNSRVIKQIFTLDPKKLKSLGIESNILSAITKLNGKKAVAATPTVNKPGQIASPSTAPPQIVNTTNRNSSELAKVPLSVSPAIKLAAHRTAVETKHSNVADKKVHVLSDVALDGLNLNNLAAIVTSKPIKSVKSISIGASEPNPSIVRASTSRVELVSSRSFKSAQCQESTNDEALPTLASTDESGDSFAGFAPSIEEIARKQLAELNALVLRSAPVKSAASENVVAPCSDASSSDESDSSDAASDTSLGELIYTAQLAIENDGRSESSVKQASHESDGEDKSANEALDEEVEKHKLIDDFLFSMKTSFRVEESIEDDGDSQPDYDIGQTAIGSSSESDEEISERVGEVTGESTIIGTIVPDEVSPNGSSIIPDSQIEFQIEEVAGCESPVHHSLVDELLVGEAPVDQLLSSENEPSIEDALETKVGMSIRSESPAIDTPKAKRQGRKPRHQQLIDDLPTMEFEETNARPAEAKSENHETSTATNRSTRQRKQRIIEDYFYAPKAKRGTTAEEKSQEEDSTETKIKTEVSQVEPTTPTPSRKSRKRKIEETSNEDVPPVETTPEPVVLRGRGRKRKSAISEASPVAGPSPRQMRLDLCGALEAPSEAANDAVEVPGQKRRSRKKAVAPQEESPVAAEASDVPEQSPANPKRGRGKQPKKVAKQTIESITCGNCKEGVSSKLWKKHELSHYGVCWRENIDPPIDLSDETVVTRIMTAFKKNKKIQYLTCPKCDEKKRSAVGYISHMQVCGLSEEDLANARVKCEHCGKTYRKVSLPIHIQSFCPVLRLQKQQEEAAFRAAAEPERVDEAEERKDENESKRHRTSRYGRKKKKRIFYEGSAATMRTLASEYVVKNRITGGTLIGWRRMLREENIIKCSMENCEFTATSCETMHSHFKTCAPRFRCSLCKHFGVDREAMAEHVSAEHADELRVQSGTKKHDDSDGGEDGDDDDDADFHASGDGSSSSGGSDSGDESSEFAGSGDETDSDWDRVLRKKPKRVKKITSLPYHMEMFAPQLWRMVRSHYQEILYLGDKYYANAMSWTHQFAAENFDRGALEIGPDGGSVGILGKPLKHARLLHSESMPFRTTSSDTYAQSMAQPFVEGVEEDECQRLPLFGSICDASSSKSAILFCGGPIVAIEWVPFSADYEGPQVLVVCSRPPNAQHTMLRGTREKCEYSIQLWKVTMRTKTEIERCELMYGIACDGPVLCMKMCPSDAFVEGDQLGLLAVPSYGGNINLLALPFGVPAAKGPTILSIKPKIVLRLGEVNEVVSQLAWSRELGHTTICAGYTNGTIAVWNLCNLNSSYLCRQNANGSRTLQPQRVFQPTQKCVTMLELHFDHTNVPRWLLVGGLDRAVHFYDLNDPFATEISSTSFKSRLTAGVWPTHWPHYICLYDSAMGFSGASANIKFVHDTLNVKTMRSLRFEGTSSNVAFSDWLNCCIFGNDSGDLFFIRFQQLLLHDRLDASSDMNVIGSTDVLHLDSQRHIVFTDIVPNVDVMNCQPLRRPTIEEMPSTKINRIAFNVNETHPHLYAVGYELGFVRINQLP